MHVPSLVRASGRLLADAFAEWRADNASRLAAALSYYTALSLAPLLMLVIAIAGMAFGDEAVRGAISSEVQGLVGPDGATVIETVLANARDKSQGVLATVASLVVLLFGATGVFAELQDSLNKVWNVEPRPTSGLWQLLRKRLLSFAMILGVAFLLLVSLVLSAALTAVMHLLDGLPEGLAVVSRLLELGLSLAVTTGLFAMMYKLLPDADIRWRHVVGGAFVTALLFTLGKYLIGLYLGAATVGSAYGAAGSLIVLLVWVYYSAQILFFGAELTEVYARQRGAPVRPTPDARRRQLDPKGTRTPPPPSAHP